LAEQAPPKQPLPAATQLVPLQQPPSPQALPAQQGPPPAPQATQVLPEQTPPAAQIPNGPKQQFWPRPPQVVHTPLMQVNPAAQPVPSQHGWLRPPQVTQVLAVPQAVLGAVQIPPLQQGALMIPQEPQPPFWQTPPGGLGHTLFAAVQVPPTQQPPPLQALPGQQDSLVAPHGWQVPPPVPMHTVPAPHPPPGQQPASCAPQL
jgi:hypothetical protein